MSAHRYILPDPDAAAEACAHHVVSVLDEMLAGEELASIAISGGTTPRLLFDKLARVKLAWNRVHVFWVDERCVPPTDEQSNYKLANDHLIAAAHIPQRNVHRILGEIEPQKAAKRYAEEIREFFGLENGELPHFDLVHRGMGPDAHTASLFPGSPLIDDREGIAAAAYVEKFHQWRVTLLPGPLLAAKHTVVLAAGSDKAQMVRAIFHEEYDPMKYPSQIGTYHGRGVAWFLDQPAAAMLD